MSFFLKNAVSNALTKLIQSKPNIDIEIVLLHDDLSQTIEKESDILYNRILLDEDEPWLNKIFDYALFNKIPPQKYKVNNSINQINKNASSFLENCGRRFMNYFNNSPKDTKVIQPDNLKKFLERIIIKFINPKNKTNTNPMYAGHFQRFIINFLRWNTLDPEENIPKLTSFLLNNCRVLAYQQLITEIIGLYDSCDTKVIYALITQMLYHSCIAVNYIRSQIENLTALNITIKSNKLSKLKNDNQPLNANKKPIPQIYSDFEESNDVEDLVESDTVPRIPWKKDVPRVNENQIKFQKVEDAEIEAYLLIMSIRTSISEYSEIINIFREDSENNYALIQALFYCGTRSTSKSLISLEAFRILSIIFNGSIKLAIKPWKNTENEKNQLDFYTNYADEMIFDPSCLTCKMIHALPVFWNHRYNKDSYIMSEEEKVKINTEDYYEDGKKHERIREKGETALEILQPCLLCEPPISSQLITFCTDIIIQIFKRRRRLSKLNKITNEDRDLMVKADGIMLDFYQHHFSYGKEYPNTTLSELCFKNVIVPLSPTDKTYAADENKRRAPLNGFIVDLSLRMTSMKFNSLFILDKLKISDMGRSKCFLANSLNEFFIYKDFTNFDLLKESTLYNINIYGELNFEKHDDDEEDDSDDSTRANIVIVDEFELNISKSKRKKDKKKPEETKKDDDEDEKDDDEENEDEKDDENKKDDKNDKKMRQSDDSRKNKSRKISKKSFKPKIKTNDDDDKHSDSSKSSSTEIKELKQKLTEKEEEIAKIKSAFSLTSQQPNKNSKDFFIDEEEENEFHTNEEHIGEGATSVTYKIIDKRTKTPICKKVLKYRNDQTIIQDAKRALNEFQILYTINHPCICKAIGINTQEPLQIPKKKEKVTTIALFLEFCEYNLEEVLGMKINNTLKTRIVLDIVHGMNFIHKKGMMHRDLKLQNIMLNSFFETKIVDFGLAKITEIAIDGFSFVEDSLTKGIGTLDYMSPEMLNQDDYDNKTDVYSFGVLLYYIFVGKLPNQQMKDKLNGKNIQLPSPSESISKFCIDLISKCLVLSPTKRPSFEKILSLLRENSFELASDVDSSILFKRDKELDFIENYK